MEYLEFLLDGTPEKIIADQKRQIAFIDESGDLGFNFDSVGVSTHFVITAILIKEDRVEELQKQVEKIRSKYFQTGEMKSSKIADDHVRRIRVLEEIRNLDFKILAFVIDKQKLDKDFPGFRYKAPFFKFVNNLVHHELYRAFPKLQLVADEHGRKEYMESFKKYVFKKHSPNLFGDYDFGFVSSKAEVMLQLSDFVCGTIATGFDLKRKSEHFSEFFEMLKEKVLLLREWPESYKNYMVNAEIKESSKFDIEIAGLAIRLAQEFINRNEKTDDLVILDQVKFLRFLLFKLKFDRPDLYVSTQEIFGNLNSLNEKYKQNVQQLRSEIVASLRDEGIIIASCKRGYKLPISIKELYDFTDQISSQVMPMLHRLQKCRDQVKLGTNGQFDILDRQEYEDLRRFFDNT